ncbi:hypothetical protein KC963_00140 [Candidatus Saccharibacteria bacterium]|nr:hypothetical protein [Candidatus Saccharibacteria bacterium]
MGILSSLFDIARPFTSAIPSIASVFQNSSLSDDLRGIADDLLTLPDRANLNNSVEQIQPVLDQYIPRVQGRFDDIFSQQSAFLDRVNTSLDDWLTAGQGVQSRLETLADRPAPEFMRPDIESYLPQQITSLSEIPGFDLASQNLERAVGRAQASQGYGQSGNILNAVADNLGQLGLSAYSDEMNRRNALFGTRATADISRYNSDIAAYEAGIKGAIAPLEVLANNITSTIGHLSGLSSRTGDTLQNNVNSMADFSQGITGNIMDYLESSQRDRAGLVGQVADSVANLGVQAAELENNRFSDLFEWLGSQGGGGTSGGTNSSGGGGLVGLIDDALSGGGDLASSLTRFLGLGGAGAGVLGSITGGLPGLTMSAGAAPGAFELTGLLGEGAGQSAGGLSQLLSGNLGTLAGFALPAGLFAAASSASRAERNSANSLADSITSQIDRAAASGRSSVDVTIGNRNFTLKVGPRGAVRQGRFFQLADGRWVGISADGKETPIVTDRPPDVSSTTNQASYVQNGTTINSPIQEWTGENGGGR